MHIEDLTEQEEQLLLMLREWGGKDDYRIAIEFRDGAWQVALSGHIYGQPKASRGVGESFGAAWDNVAPSWT
jgi:hypothetical protein